MVETYPVLEVTDTPKSLIIKEFGVDSIMLDIARCESNFRQFDKTGEVLRGVVNSKDVGLFQVNEYYHLAQAESLGIDLYSTEGNIAYARELYNTAGTTPWGWSKSCWS